MKATITVELRTDSVKRAQKALINILDEMKIQNIPSNYSFQIEGQEGIVTERCVLSEWGVVA